MTAIATQDCPICLEALGDTSQNHAILHKDEAIQHVFHKACLDQWYQVKKNCPTCRKPLSKIRPLEIETSSRNIVLTVFFHGTFSISNESIYSLLQERSFVLRTISHFN